MDMKKELKFSDLIPKRKSGGGSSQPKAVAKKKKAKQDYVGVKVGASQIAAAEVHNNGGSKIVKLAREPLEAGVVVGGEVRDIPALARALDEFFRKHELPRKGVRLGIGTNRVGVRVLDVDGIDDEKQLANAVTFRAHEALSIPMDQAVMDYHVVGTQTLDKWSGFSGFLYDTGTLVGPDGKPLTARPDFATWFTDEYLAAP